MSEVSNPRKYEILLCSQTNKKIQDMITAADYYLVRFRPIKSIMNGDGYKIDDSTFLCYLLRKSDNTIKPLFSSIGSKVMPLSAAMNLLWNEKIMEYVRTDVYECGVSGLMREEYVYQIPEDFLLTASMMLI